MSYRKKTKRQLKPTARETAKAIENIEKGLRQLKKLLPTIDILERDCIRYARGLDEVTHNLSLKEPL